MTWHKITQRYDLLIQAYREYISSLKKQAMESSRIIKPGYYIRALGDDKETHILNICKSKAVEKPKNSWDIPTLMSEKRLVHDKNRNEISVRDYFCV
jgi:hypothetical protein